MSKFSSKRSIFISYRRDDSGGEAGRLFDDLTRAFDPNTVFMDVAGIEPGTDFRKAIDANVASAGVFLAVIGPSWLNIASSDGSHRLDDHNDFVRLEVAAALNRNIPVIPVLVHGAPMPHADELPDDLKDLAYRNAVELTLARWQSDVALLIQALGNYVHVAPEAATQTVHAAIPVQLPAPDPSPAKPTGNSLLLGVIAGCFLLGFAIVYIAHYLLTSSSKPATPPAQSQASLPFNAIGIASPGSTRSDSDGIDHKGDAFHAFVKLVDSSTQTMKLANGDVFKIGPTDANNILHPQTGQSTTISLPNERYTMLAILATADGAQQPQPFSIDYSTPGSSPLLLLQGMSDWLFHPNSTRFANESVAAVQPDFIASDGTARPGPVALYEYRFRLNNTVPIKSVTLPGNSNLSIVAVTLIP